ncbi:Succinate-semialdehyde dehydrogenase [Fusarium sp. LHS14.1]|nr:Succinate-semialdehyde dehydrogenase [Fusarium sp. LHS14.1]
MASFQENLLVVPNSTFIAGDWLTVAQDQCFVVYDPATSKPVAYVPDLDSRQCEQAVEGAKEAQKKLALLTAKDKSRLLRKWFELVQVVAGDLADIITRENGKPLEEAKGEVKYASDFIDWFSGEAERFEGAVYQSSNHNSRIVIIKQPVGVVGIVTPWNFPAAMVTRKVAAALAAGCPCVIKPAPETPLSAVALAHLAHQSGFPVGSLSILTTRRHTVQVGKVLTQHPDIRKFSFTGSTTVGKVLAAQCTGTMKRVSLELGGNAAVIVFDDADCEKAVEGIMTSKFRLSGQTCVCANRVFVHSSIYDKLSAMLVAKVQQLKLGVGHEPETTLEPLITEAAVDKVAMHVQDAVARGARVVTGGSRATELGPTFFEPTVLVDVAADSRCAAETFGPLLPLFKFEDEEEVVRLANSLSVGLAGYFFTRDIARAWRVAESLEVGMVGVNTGLISNVASPFGGVKESVQGREGSKLGIEEFLEIKSVTFGL